MIDWFAWAMGLVQGVIVAVLGGYIMFVYLFPKMTAKTTRNTVEALKKDPEIAPMIDKAKEIVNKLHPLADQFKGLDLVKMQSEFQPLLDGIKTIDPKEIQGLIKNLKELTGTVKNALEKPKIPEPTID
jgi:hypothetical protein